MRVLVLLAILAPGAALARQVEKPAQPAPSAEARAATDRVLARRVGKPPPASLAIFNGHTHEWLVVDLAPNATVSQETWNTFLRCHFTNQSTQMDRRLLTVLVRAALKFKRDRVFVVSGYRAPKFNLQLRKKGREVASQSQHSQGNAIDFRLTDVPTTKLRDFVTSLRLGGVGFYPESAFVHADTGPRRKWIGR